MSSCQQNRYWSDRLFAAKSLHDSLPLKVKCGQRELIVKYALESEVTSRLPEMMKESFLRGDNVGVDELDEPYFDRMIKTADIFAVRRLNAVHNADNNHDDVIVAFIVVAISMHKRSLDSCLADLRVIRSCDVTDEDYVEITRLAVELTKRFDCGFTDCLMPVARSCGNLIDALVDQLGFRVAVTVPVTVNMAAVGLTDSLLMTCNLGITDRPRRSMADVIAFLEKFGIADGPEDDAWFQSLTLPSLSCLPLKYRLQKSGYLVNFRNIEPADDRAVFELIEASAQRGEGFDTNDVATLAAARHLFLSVCNTVIVEDVEKNTIIAWMMMSPCALSRSPLAKYGEGCLVISRECQNRGIGNELAVLSFGLAKQLGYKWFVLDHFANNIRSDKVMKQMGMMFIGTIPRSGYIVGNGWTDVIVTCKDLTSDKQKTLFEIIESSQPNMNAAD